MVVSVVINILHRGRPKTPSSTEVIASQYRRLFVLPFASHLLVYGGVGSLFLPSVETLGCEAMAADAIGGLALYFFPPLSWYLNTHAPARRPALTDEIGTTDFATDCPAHAALPPVSSCSSASLICFAGSRKGRPVRAIIRRGELLAVETNHCISSVFVKKAYMTGDVTSRHGDFKRNTRD